MSTQGAFAIVNDMENILIKINKDIRVIVNLLCISY